MREFTALAWYMVRDRRVVAVRLDRDEEREGLLASLQAEGVMVDGVEYRIDGVESFAIPTLRTGMEIGLRVVDTAVGS